MTLAIEGHRAFAGPVRLKGVFSVELAAPGGPDAQHNLQINAMPGEWLRVQWFHTASGLDVETLGRPVVELWRESDGVNVNQAQTAWLQANKLQGGTGSK